VITILFLILCVPLGFGYVRFLGWLVRLGERMTVEPLGDAPEMEEPAPCPTALTPDCPTIVAGSDLDDSQWAGIVAQFSDLPAIDVNALEAFYEITNPPYVPRHAKQED